MTSWTDFDKNHVWHPYASITRPLPVYPVVSARGVRLFLEDGRELIDGMASWWDGCGADGKPVASGVYIALLRRGGSSELLKFALVR